MAKKYLVDLTREETDRCALGGGRGRASREATVLTASAAGRLDRKTVDAGGTELESVEFTVGG